VLASSLLDSNNLAYLIIGDVVGLITIAGILRRGFRHEIKAVLDEVRPNGGTTKSLGDTVKRTEQAITDHAAQDLKVQKKLNKKMNRLEEQLAAHEQAAVARSLREEPTKL